MPDGTVSAERPVGGAGGPATAMGCVVPVIAGLVVSVAVMVLRADRLEGDGEHAAARGECGVGGENRLAVGGTEVDGPDVAASGVAEGVDGGDRHVVGGAAGGDGREAGEGENGWRDQAGCGPST